MIRILIVDDSAVVTMLLKAIFEEQPDMVVVGQAKHGREAVAMVASLQPDLVTMDIQMPVMDGLEATREIMSKHPVPIIVVSSAVKGKDAQISFRAIEEGALWVIEKPPGISHPNFDLIRRELVDTVRSMAGMRVVRRKTGNTGTTAANVSARHGRKTPDVPACELVALGCSTGGPQALLTILAGLPADFPAPILAVQHISNGFTEGMVAWLALNSPLQLKVAEDGEMLQSGTVYFAPDDQHLLVKRVNGELCAILDHGPPVNRFRPSATPLLESVARTCPRGALGMLLTGMGNDGALGLLAMRKAGCHTVAQDKESSVVFGMPHAALELEAVDLVISLQEMATYLCANVTNRVSNILGGKG